jgi:glycosyltransferase involved in cell wall biosynthesis
MRVLHLLEATSGGTRRHILDLLPAQVRAGISCELLASPLRNAHWDADVRFLRARGVRVLAVPMQRGFAPPCDAAAIQEIISHWRASRPDLVHCHSTKAGFLGRLARPLCGFTPLVYTPHCIAFDTQLPSSQRRLALLVESVLAPSTSHFLAVSHHEKRAIQRARLASSTRITTIHNGIDMKGFDALSRPARRDYGLHETDFVIGCFGRLTAQKNQSALVRALPRVLAEQKNARLFFVGGGEDETKLRLLCARLKVSARVVFAGDVGEARPLLFLCDLVVQPSRWEGCPYSVLEAMAARRAILATRVGGVAELLAAEADEVPGQLVGEARAVTLSRDILALSQNALQREKLGAVARKRAEAMFSLPAMCEATTQLYARVLAR